MKEHFVGLFNEQQLREKADKLAIDKAMNETGFKYIKSKLVKKKGVQYSEVYLVETFEQTNFSLNP